MRKIKPSSQQIGKAGELLVQYRLLKYGIDSAPLTTDSGIDLVAYSPLREEALTIQVKTNAKPKAGGGKGAPALDWWLKRTSPAELVALVNLKSEEVWLFSLEEFIEAAQQQPDEVWLHFYMYVDGGVKTRTGKKADTSENAPDHDPGERIGVFAWWSLRISAFSAPHFRG